MGKKLSDERNVSKTLSNAQRDEMQIFFITLQPVSVPL
jgi:hypothetical protein